MYVLMTTLHVLLLTHIYRVSINVHVVCLNDYITSGGFRGGRAGRAPPKIRKAYDIQR